MSKGTFNHTWTDASGRSHVVTDLEDSHLRNIVRFLIDKLNKTQVQAPEGIDLGNLFREDVLAIKRDIGIALAEAKKRGLV